MKTVAIFFGLALALILPARAQPGAIVGTWQLQSFVRQDAGTGQKHYGEYGPHPIGYLIYTPDGHMLMQITMDNRITPSVPVPTDKEKAALYSTLVAYGGTYTIAGNKVTHHIEISWNGTWNGSSQARYFAIDGDQLTLTNADATRSPIDGTLGRSILVWKKLR